MSSHNTGILIMKLMRIIPSLTSSGTVLLKDKAKVRGQITFIVTAALDTQDQVRLLILLTSGLYWMIGETSVCTLTREQ